MNDAATPAARTRVPRRLDGRVLVPALLISGLIHILALVVVEFHLPAHPERSSLPPLRNIRIEPVMKVYDLVEVSIDAAPIEVQVRERELARDELAVPQIDAPVAPGIPAAPPAVDPARGRLEYRLGAGEVWRPPVAMLELSADQNARNRVAARLHEYNDSMAAEAGARAKANDWTVRTADGGRWGVTADSIYIGDIAVKNIIQFSPPPGRREEVAGRLRTYGEIQYQVTRIEGNDIINDRIKAIRQRMDAERAKRNSTSGGGTTGGTTGGATTGTVNDGAR